MIPKVFQDESKVKPKSVQHESKLIPKPGPGRSDKGRKRVGLFLKTLLSLIVFCAGYLSYVSDTCLMCLILVLCAGVKSYVQGSKFSSSVFLWRESSMAWALYGVNALWRERSMAWTLYGVNVLWRERSMTWTLYGVNVLWRESPG